MYLFIYVLQTIRAVSTTSSRVVMAAALTTIVNVTELPTVEMDQMNSTAVCNSVVVVVVVEVSFIHLS